MSTTTRQELIEELAEVSSGEGEIIVRKSWLKTIYDFVSASERDVMAIVDRVIRKIDELNGSKVKRPLRVKAIKWRWIGNSAVSSDRYLVVHISGNEYEYLVKKTNKWFPCDSLIRGIELCQRHWEGADGIGQYLEDAT